MHNGRKVVGLRTEGCTDNLVLSPWYLHTLPHMNPLLLLPLGLELLATLCATVFFAFSFFISVIAFLSDLHWDSMCPILLQNSNCSEP